MASSPKIFTIIHSLGLTKHLARHSKSLRKELLAGVHYNPLLLTHEMVPYDLLTDSLLFNVLSSPRFISKGHHENDFIRLDNVLKSLFPFKYVFPLSQGRTSEWFMSQLLDIDGKIVITNSLFPTTRIHLEQRGARVVECLSKESFDMDNGFPFKGNIDMEKIKTIVAEKGIKNVGAIYMEMADNAHAGQPFSMENLSAVSIFAKSNSIPLILDGCRIIDQALMIQKREKDFSRRSILEIVSAMCKQADCMTMSLAKNFLLEQGAIIGFNDDFFEEKMQDLLMVVGDGLSLRQKSIISRVLSRSQNSSFNKLKKRSIIVKELWKKLKSYGVPVVSPCSSFAVYIDCGELTAQSSLGDFPLKSFVDELFIRSGILVSESMISSAQEVAGISMIRVIIPLDSVNFFNYKYVARHIASLWNDKENILPIRSTKMSHAKSAIYSAQFSR